MKFIFREFSEEMPASRLTTSEPEEHCSRSWFISSNTEVGVHLWKWASMGRVSPRKIGSSSSCKRRYIYQSREDIKHRRSAFATNAQSACVIPLIVPYSCMWH